MRAAPRLRVALVLACALHAGALATVRRTASRAAAPAAAGDVARLEIDVEAEPEAAPTSAGAGAVAVATPEPRSRGQLAGARPAEAPSALAPPAATAATGADGVVTAPREASGEGWSIRTTTVDLGIGIHPNTRPLLALGAGAEAPPAGSAGPSAAPRTASRTGGLVEALDAADVAHGLGRGGLVNTAVHDAAQASSVMGKAIFAITIDGAGKVTVGVSSATEDEIGWAGLSETIRASVAARAERGQMRLPPGGLRIAVETEAKEQYPNGAKPKDMGTKGVAKGPSVTETKERVDLHLPELAVVHRGKVCAVGVSLIPPFVGGGCDPSNIGAVAQRIVTARIVSETRL